jgi:hypothetical protein
MLYFDIEPQNQVEEEEENTILTKEFIKNLGKFKLKERTRTSPKDKTEILLELSVQSKVKFLFKKISEHINLQSKQKWLEDIDSVIYARLSLNDFVAKYKTYLFNDTAWTGLTEYVLDNIDRRDIDTKGLHDALLTRFNKYMDMLFDRIFDDDEPMWTGILKVDKQSKIVKEFYEGFLGLDLKNWKHGVPVFRFNDIYHKILRKKFSMKYLEKTKPDDTILNLLKVLDILENDNIEERETLLKPKYSNAFTKTYDFTKRQESILSIPVDNILPK